MTAVHVLIALALAALAVPGGAPLVRAVFWAAAPAAERSGPVWRAALSGAGADDGVLRGGRWIGYLERLGVTVTLMAGYPGGVAVIAGVKTLARYAELHSQPVPGSDAAAARRQSQAAIEQFIIGTMASMIWAVLLALLSRWMWGLW